jgi:mRNA interferase HigB
MEVIEKIWSCRVFGVNTFNSLKPPYAKMLRLTTSQIVKYGERVHIVTRRHLTEAMKQNKDAASEIEAWAGIVEAVRWHSFTEVREMFKDADYVDGYVIFNIRRNRYRLITVIHYAKTTEEKQTDGHVYIRSCLTHKEYDNRNNWDRRFGSK